MRKSQTPLDANGFVNRRSTVQSCPPAPENSKKNARPALITLALGGREQLPCKPRLRRAVLRALMQVTRGAV